MMNEEFQEYPLFSPDKLDDYVRYETGIDDLDELDDTDLHFTNDIEQAMYLFPDGRMISSTFEGMRGLDHNCIGGFEGLPNIQNEDFWEKVYDGIGAVRVIPETEVAMISDTQCLSQEQKEILDNSYFTVEEGYHSKGIYQEPQVGLSENLSVGVGLSNGMRI
jgi:hypothetical protein